jgi:putative spermidine/putrescine transport system permease protein
MPERARRERLLVALLALAATLPILTLAVRALADVWRAPAILPQQLGLRGVRYALSAGAGVPEAVLNGIVIALLAASAACGAR